MDPPAISCPACHAPLQAEASSWKVRLLAFLLFLAALGVAAGWLWRSL